MNCRDPQDDPTMRFAEQILQLFQIVAPTRVLLRQKIFYRVAEVLDADSKFMPANRGARPQSAFMQVVSFHPLFKREMQVDEASRPHPGGPLRKRFAPLPPLLAIELIEIFTR